MEATHFLTMSFISGFIAGVVTFVFLITAFLIITKIVRRRRYRKIFNIGFGRMEYEDMVAESRKQAGDTHVRN